ncbi:DNA-processing protein DprA [Actinotignum urinale]|uniref:DNA-processing protein DprA n=1 Tax=Actinotignum urinale TaxID=190146 RepID=UPI002A80B380|nr:DNA-processing protein DprA [Actinotignum urinale]MDY5129182.1 DNA-processing protein DprA [Actinotignum urinale]
MRAESITYDAESLAAMAWTRIAEGEDVQAVALTENLGYEGALSWLKDAMAGADVPDELRRCVARWSLRCDENIFERDRKSLAQNIGEPGLIFARPGQLFYPRELMDLGNMKPLGLWINGNPHILGASTVSMVGSRQASQAGLNIAEDLAYELAYRGALVCSGGAFGIDAAAHRGALKAGKPTLSVFASGADKFYPLSNQELFENILSTGGAIISESPPGSTPHRHRFLARNRIIAALGKASIIVEAPYRSGAINTAHHALNIGREVGALPERWDNPHYQGSFKLLRNGATLIRNVEDVVELCGWTQGVRQTVSQQSQSFMKKAEMVGGAGQAEMVGRAGAVEPTNQTNEKKLDSHLSLDDPMAGNSLAVRVRDALHARLYWPADKIASEAGVSIREALSGLGLLVMAGIAEESIRGWRLSPNTQRRQNG